MSSSSIVRRSSGAVGSRLSTTGSGIAPMIVLMIPGDWPDRALVEAAGTPWAGGPGGRAVDRIDETRLERGGRAEVQ